MTIKPDAKISLKEQTIDYKFVFAYALLLLARRRGLKPTETLYIDLHEELSLTTLLPKSVDPLKRVETLSEFNKEEYKPFKDFITELSSNYNLPGALTIYNTIISVNNYFNIKTEHYTIEAFKNVDFNQNTDSDEDKDAISRLLFDEFNLYVDYPESDVLPVAVFNTRYRNVADYNSGQHCYLLTEKGLTIEDVTVLNHYNSTNTLVVQKQDGTKYFLTGYDNSIYTLGNTYAVNESQKLLGTNYNKYMHAYTGQYNSNLINNTTDTDLQTIQQLFTVRASAERLSTKRVITDIRDSFEKFITSVNIDFLSADVVNQVLIDKLIELIDESNDLGASLGVRELQRYIKDDSDAKYSNNNTIMYNKSIITTDMLNEIKTADAKSLTSIYRKYIHTYNIED